MTLLNVTASSAAMILLNADRMKWYEDLSKHNKSHSSPR